MFFESWAGLGRVLVVGPLAYVALVVVLRCSGKRTLTKLNAFDLVVTVAFGSTLSTILLSKNVALAEGVLAFVLLALMQFVLTRLSVWSPRIEGLVKARPSLLFHRGQFLDGALRAERVTREDVLAVLRSDGAGDPSEIAAVVLEADGSFSVLSSTSAGPLLQGFAGSEEREAVG